MYRTEEQWIQAYQDREALWFHDGNPRRPHALLSAGRHSNGYFNSELIIQESALLDQAAADLLSLLQKAGLNITYVERVVGPAMGAITLAHDLARHIGYATQSACLRGYTIKAGEKGGETMAFDDRVQVQPGEKVLLAEDVVTTFRTVKLTAEVLIDKEAVPLPFVSALVNRSGETEVSQFKIVALIQKPMATWDAIDCPLCKEGSRAIRPKARENWTQLVGTL